MRLLHSIALTLWASSSVALAASAWGFKDGLLNIPKKGGGYSKEGLKTQIDQHATLQTSAITLTDTDPMTITLTTTEGNTAKKPHQAFLRLREQATGLEESFAFSVKENGQAKLELHQNQLPYQLLTSSQPLKAYIVIGSFGSSKAFDHLAFNLNMEEGSVSSPSIPSAPERYTSKPQIHHQFRPEPQSSYRILSLIFTLAVLISLPALFGGWLYLGGNIDHMQKALGSTPVAHGLFFGSIVAMEGVFFMYYLSWNLFQTLSVAAVVGAVAFVSGSRALTEVQERRLAGER